MMTSSRLERRSNNATAAGREKTATAADRGSFPIIAMAASEGGLKALSVILGGLPADFPAAIAIVMHLSPHHESILAEILDSRSPLKVKEAKDGDFLCRSCAFVAPPNHHLLVGRSGCLKLSGSTAEKINYARPSAEPLFVSVAKVYQQNAIAVVLTGGDGDGSFGVQIIKDEGGLVIAQDRPTSENFSMPETSIKTGDVDFILPLDEIGPKLIELVERGPARGTASLLVRPKSSKLAKTVGDRGGKKPEGLGFTHQLSSSLHSPSPQPFPAGRGSHSARTRTERTRPSRPSRPSRRGRDTILPLPEGEGRGEGARPGLSKKSVMTRPPRPITGNISDGRSSILKGLDHSGKKDSPTLKGLRHRSQAVRSRKIPARAGTPTGLEKNTFALTQGSSPARNPGLNDGSPSGFMQAAKSEGKIKRAPHRHPPAHSRATPRDPAGTKPARGVRARRGKPAPDDFARPGANK